MIAAIKETCSCGATFEASTDGLPGMRAADWRQQHQHGLAPFTDADLLGELVRRGLAQTLVAAADLAASMDVPFDEAIERLRSAWRSE